MELSRLLPPSHLIMNLRGDSPEAIIRTLCQPLADEGAISDLDDFVTKVLEREQIYTTQILENVAFPHAHADQVRTISLVIGLTAPEGIAFAPNTPGKCRLFFLIAVPAAAPEAHLELMANLVDFVMSSKLQELLDAQSPEQILKLIAEY